MQVLQQRHKSPPLRLYTSQQNSSGTPWHSMLSELLNYTLATSPLAAAESRSSADATTPQSRSASPPAEWQANSPTRDWLPPPPPRPRQHDAQQPAAHVLAARSAAARAAERTQRSAGSVATGAAQGSPDALTQRRWAALNAHALESQTVQRSRGGDASFELPPDHAHATSMHQSRILDLPWRSVTGTTGRTSWSMGRTRDRSPDAAASDSSAHSTILAPDADASSGRPVVVQQAHPITMRLRTLGGLASHAAGTHIRSSQISNGGGASSSGRTAWLRHFSGQLGAHVGTYVDGREDSAASVRAVGPMPLPSRPGSAVAARLVRDMSTALQPSPRGDSPGYVGNTSA